MTIWWNMLHYSSWLKLNAVSFDPFCKTTPSLCLILINQEKCVLLSAPAPSTTASSNNVVLLFA